MENDMTFKREQRYLVIKMEDVLGALQSHDPYSASYTRLYDAYYTLTDMVNSYRYKKDKLPNEYVVVGKDWPEYETVWKMIEDRHNA